MLDDVGGENCAATQCVYLGTVSRVLPGNASAYRDLERVAKAGLVSMVRDAVDNPVGAGCSLMRHRSIYQHKKGMHGE